MILVDSNIIIDFWDMPTKRRGEIFRQEKLFVCGIIRAELLHGAKDKRDFQLISDALDDLHSLPITEKTWDNAGHLLYRLKAKGFTVPLQDATIACLAIEYNCRVWTEDKHFAMIQTIEPSLGLFKE